MTRAFFKASLDVPDQTELGIGGFSENTYPSVSELDEVALFRRARAGDGGEVDV